MLDIRFKILDGNSEHVAPVSRKTGLNKWQLKKIDCCRSKQPA